MQRKLLVSLILITIFMGLGAGTAILLIKTAPVPPQVDLARPPLLVEAVQVEPDTVTESLVGFGTARAECYARLSAQVGGEIVAVADDLKVGTEVEQDQVLVRIDEHEYKQQLARVESLLAADKALLEQLETEASNLERLITPAQRELASAQFEYDQVQDLYKEGAAPKREHEQARLILEQTRRMLLMLENQQALLPARRAQLKANRENHQAELAIARLDLDRCTIRAPFAGRVAEKLIEVGERVQKGSPLLSLLDPALIEVPVELPDAVRSRIAVGAACTLTMPSQPGVSWKGHVKRIAPAANEATRTFELFVEVNNAEHKNELVPGFFVQAEIEGPTLVNVLLVPRASVQQNQLFVYKNGQAGKRDVQVTRVLRDQSVVTGIQPGDVVITSNLDALYEGAAVRLASVPTAGSDQARPTPETHPAVAERRAGQRADQK